MSSYVLHHDDRSTLWPQVVFQHVVDHVRLQGHEVKCEGRGTFRTNFFGRMQRVATLEDSFAVLQDVSTDHYIVMDCHDWTVPEDLRLYLRDPRCELILKCQFRPAETRMRRRLTPGQLNDVRGMRRAIVQPWTYFDLHWPQFHELHLELRSAVRTDQRMFFRGGLSGFDPDRSNFKPGRNRDMKNMRRPTFEALAAMGVMNDDPEWIPYEPYIKEMSGYRIALSLSGDGEFCHRDMEALGIQVPLLRPRMRNQMHDPLKEDYHYISVDADPERDSPTEMAKKVADRYHTVIEQPDFLDTVARNGAAWYDRNVAPGPAMALTTELLGIRAMQRSELATVR